MTPDSKVAWVLEAFERWNSGDRTPPIERFDPDVEIHAVIGAALEGKPYRGHEGVRAWLAALDENFETWKITPQDIHDLGDTVVILGNVHYRGRGSGVETDQPVAWVAQFREDKVVRLQTYLDHQKALADTGLSNG